MPPPLNTIARAQVPTMSQESLKFTYLSDLLGRHVHGFPGDKHLGRLVDLAASPEKVYPRVTGLLVKKPFRAAPMYIPWSCVHWPGANRPIGIKQSTAEENGAARPAESDILLQPLDDNPLRAAPQAAVQLSVFNTLGQQVAQLVNGEQEAGYNEVKIDASGLSSGVDFYRMQAGVTLGKSPPYGSFRRKPQPNPDWGFSLIETRHNCPERRTTSRHFWTLIHC